MYCLWMKYVLSMNEIGTVYGFKYNADVQIAI